MSFQRVLTVAVLAGALMLPLTAVQAQSLGDKSVPGVCMLSRGAVMSQSKVGQAADRRLKQLIQQADSQLKAKQKPLSAAVQTFRKNAESMSDSERQSEQKSLQQRLQAFQQDKQKLNVRVRITRAKAMKRIGKAIDPVVANVYKQRDCGILLDRDTVLGGNQANDLTAAVIKGLDAKMSTISFNLAPYPQQASQQSK
ncbi:MAG TPA: OmpH family outer membrane protein [Oleiagrimonas sp.]|nr:OmpH family outer membrane protein [Oleiagrimonas sp.]